MSWVFKVTTEAGKPVPYDLCAEALTSSAPPLSPQSQQRIEEIRQARLCLLEGTEVFEVDRVFDAANKMPPIEGFRCGRLLSLLADSDFTMEDFHSVMDDLTGENPGYSPQKDGTVSVPVSTRVVSEELSSEAQGELQLNLSEAVQGGIKASVEIIRHLSEVSDPLLRRQVVQDCLHIFELRLDFHLADRGR